MFIIRLHVYNVQVLFTIDKLIFDVFAIFFSAAEANKHEFLCVFFFLTFDDCKMRIRKEKERD